MEVAAMTNTVRVAATQRTSFSDISANFSTCSRLVKESSFTEAEKEIAAVDSPFGHLGLTVCYDFRFPELYQQHSEDRESYGDSKVIDPWGTIIRRLPDQISTGITIADINFLMIESVKTKMPISQHRKPIGSRRLDSAVSL